MKANCCATVLLILTAGAHASSWRYGGSYIRHSPGQGQDQSYHQGHEHQGHGSRSSRWRWETGQQSSGLQTSDTESLVFNYDDPWRFLLEYNQRTTPRPAPPMKVLPVHHSGELVRVRAIPGHSQAGVLEVYRAGRWGIVCDDSWDLQDAAVACRQLGFKDGAESTVGEGFFGMISNRWTRDDIVMDEVNCDGSESQLQFCDYSPTHDCQASEAATVTCKPNPGCPEGWVSSSQSCYKFLPKAARDVDDAEAQCAGLSASLLAVDSLQENHFLSNALSHTWAVEDSVWYTSGRRSKQEWRWTKNRVDKKDNSQQRNDRRRRPHRDVSRRARGGDPLGMRVNQRASASFTRWFPGWLPAGRGQEPSSRKGHDCLVLTDRYSLPNGITVSVDYFYWKARPCTGDAPISFICQTPVSERSSPHSECYKGNGEDYRGTLSYTDSGTPCIPWTESRSTITSHQGLGDHNYCRNPDGDSRPWCWVDYNEFGYCPVPPCSGTTAAPSVHGITAMDREQCGLRPLEDDLPRLHGRRRRRRRHALVASAYGLNSTEPRRMGDPPRIQKIVGGDIAQHGLYPWQVGVKIIYNIYDNGEVKEGPWCGGTVINKFWVLSAAHCFTMESRSLHKSRISIVVGDHGFETADKGEQRFFVEELILHNGYESATYDNDIALLKIKSEDGQGMKFGDNVQPACLPRSHTAYRPGLRCLISGWGQIGNDKSSSFLRAAEVPLISDHVCNRLYRGKLTRSMLCAGYLEGRVDTCQGDSGGPLVCKVDGRYTVLGVTSWGLGCAQPTSPGIYTKTHEFLAWIEDTLRIYS